MGCVLLVDDDAEQLAIRKLLLAGSGHQVETAQTLPEAIRMLGALQPGVLIMDLCMPTLEDGVALIRSVEEQKLETKIIVLSGWPSNLSGLPERSRVSHVFAKPFRTELLLKAIRELLLVVVVVVLCSARLRAENFRFSVSRDAEVVADLEMSSPGSDWSQSGREAAMAALTLDSLPTQHVMLFAGEDRYTYSVFLGMLPAGAHELRIDRHVQYSAVGSGLKVWAARFRPYSPGDPYYDALAHAPVLFARADSVGRFSDVPLIAYCERLTENGRNLLQYTVIFSNEDGGTSTRALMARWGRTSDIEYIYRAWLGSPGEQRATIQASGHEEIEFRGRRDGSHPLLTVSTRNNMVAPEGSSPVRYQLAPLLIDLVAHSREQVMDEHPVTYRVMAQELARESKLRDFAMVDGEKVSDPRNYLYVEGKVANRNSAIAAAVRLKGEPFCRFSHLGRIDYAIERSGWFRTTVELPPRTTKDAIATIGFECLVAPAQPLPPSGVCTLEAVSKIFLLDDQYRPGPVFWRHTEPVTIPAGEAWLTEPVSGLAGNPQ